MTSTNTFQGMDESARPSSRVLRPPGGGSSSIFGATDAPQTTVKAQKMTSNIFGSPEERRELPKKSNPPEIVQEKTEPSPAKANARETHAPTVDDHEPRLGPRPRSHNKVIHPPGGKSSVAFY
ncbi:jupiter microtubule associated homolog 2 [Protopterus annectens]|uniref:jupiter microtubule associated homolog 2 n=1 Tax=Protopterus annectens TaxID=7888 RepID=UPI001CFBF8D8|nr:jupiter microtubule associated homolog 2 [Protopterus annectens]